MLVTSAAPDRLHDRVGGSAALPPRDGRDSTELGLAQELAAALWEAEDGQQPSLPTAVPLVLSDGPGLAATPPASGAPAWFTARIDELVRLQERAHDHVEKLYAENRVLREGELVQATVPLLLGLARLGDQMESLAASEGPEGCAALLRTQLLQILETAAGVTPFAPTSGDAFDSAAQRGVRVVGTDDAEQGGRVASTVRPGFRRADGSVLRVAEVEVFRASPPRTGPAAAEEGGAS